MTHVGGIVTCEFATNKILKKFVIKLQFNLKHLKVKNLIYLPALNYAFFYLDETFRMLQEGKIR